MQFVLKNGAAATYTKLIFEDSAANQWAMTPITADFRLKAPTAKELVYASLDGQVTAGSVRQREPPLV